MKQRSILITMSIVFVEMIVAFFLSWHLFQFIVAAILPIKVLDSNYDIVTFISVPLGILTSLLSVLILAANQNLRLRQAALAASSNINVFVERGDALLGKANRIVSQQMGYEHYTLTKLAEIQAGAKSDAAPVKPQGAPKGSVKTKTVKNAATFRSVVDAFPELKANESVMRLLGQIQICENEIATAKLTYNDLATSYNTAIHTFPGFLVRGKAQNLLYYTQNVDEEFSDEELGL